MSARSLRDKINATTFDDASICIRARTPGRFIYILEA